MRLGETFCPGVQHAVPARDGLLVRIRVPGGLIEAAQLRAVASLASRFADGSIEITSRANLQLRGIEQSHVTEIAAGIAAAGLLPSPEHDRVRNIVTSPLTGLESADGSDMRPFVRELDRRLSADSLYADLHPKFSFGLFGSSRRLSRDGDDLSLEACADGSGLRLSIGGVPTESVLTVEDAVAGLLQAARLCLSIARESGIPVRAKRILAIPGALTRIVDGVGSRLASSEQPATYVEVQPGVRPAGHAGYVNLIPSVALGRLTAQQAGVLAQLVMQVKGDLRLAPWRGVVLGAIPAASAQETVRELAACDLPCDSWSGFYGIAACAGMTGCDAALADVRADATVLARRLAGMGVPAKWTVNFSGCEKQCARRHGASADLIASASGYSLRIGAETSHSSCSAELAIETIAAFHARRMSEALSR